MKSLHIRDEARNVSVLRFHFYGCACASLISSDCLFSHQSTSLEEVASFDKISATQLAEQLTFLEHLLFSRIPAQ